MNTSAMNASANAGLRQRAIGAGLDWLGASGLPALAAPLTRGRGAILMFHHVRPWTGGAFAPNRGLEITPEFLDLAITTVRARGFEIITLDAAMDSLSRRKPEGPPFCVLTFDDGYRDNLVHALPVLRRRQAPFTLYITTGFAERTARLWWIELEAALRALNRVGFIAGGGQAVIPSDTDAKKTKLFNKLYWHLRAQPEDVLLAAAEELTDQAGIDRRALVENLCMDWDEIGEFALEPLCTIGVHTLTHPRLAKHPLDFARKELAESRAIIEARIGRPAAHLAWPVGDPTSAGPREFALARDLGFASAATTRKGMVFGGHAGHPMALPRLSVNGGYQTKAALEVLLSGAPFWLRNLGRRLDVN